MRTKYLFHVSILILFCHTHANTIETKASADVDYKVEQIAQGLGVIWAMAFLNDTEIIFTQRSGGVGLLNITTKNITKLSGAPEVFSKGQGGMMDVNIPPHYQAEDWIYFTYAKPIDSDEAATTLSRAKLAGNQLVNWQDILVTKSKSNAWQHFGSRIIFDDNGHLFFGIGDRGHRPNGQDLKNHSGALLRLKINGEIPKDNPFVDNSKALPEIWSYGHRNPQGLAYDTANKRLWEIEHGPRGGDEINLIKLGQNYGWPIISYGKEYWGPLAVGEGTHKKGMQQPSKVYTPSIAPSSLMLYNGEAFPNWQGNLFAGALKLRHLNRIIVNNQAEIIAERRLLTELDERIRSITQDTKGLIYIGTDSGKILAITPVN